MLALLEHCQTLIDAQSGLYAALLGAGLVGSMTHCAGMCGPFVATQVAARLESVPAESMREWHRLRGAALLPYHLGRLTTYMLLGAVAGGVSSFVFASAYFSLLSSLMLGVAGLLFLLHGLGLHRPSTQIVPHGRFLASLSAPLWARPVGLHGYVLGTLLGFLPCGMVMAALMAVATTGSASASALGMALFGLGTIPALFAVGLGSAWLMGRWRTETRLAARGAMALNGVVLCGMAVNHMI